MSYLQCPECGLSNWSTHRQCLKCYAPLEALEGFHAAQPTIGKNSRKRILLVGVGLLVLLTIAGVVVAYRFTGQRKFTNPNAALEAALSASAEFNAPVLVEVGRYSFYNLDERRIDQEATPEAYVLSSLGLLYIHNGMYSDVPMTRTKDGGLLVDQQTGLVPQQYRHIQIEITRDGQEQSAAWEHYQVKTDGKEGWKVPIGQRQFGRVVQVMQLPEGQPTGDSVMVSFTWKWKPNEVGQSFDKRSSSYQSADKPANFPRSSFEVVINDTQAVYWGTAELMRVSGGWEAHRISWIGTQGVSLSSGALEQIDKIVEESRTPR